MRKPKKKERTERKTKTEGGKVSGILSRYRFPRTRSAAGTVGGWTCPGVGTRAVSGRGQERLEVVAGRPPTALRFPGVSRSATKARAR